MEVCIFFIWILGKISWEIDTSIDTLHYTQSKQETRKLLKNAILKIYTHARCDDFNEIHSEDIFILSAMC